MQDRTTTNAIELNLLANLRQYCPTITPEELDFCKNNGGYNAAYLRLKRLKSLSVISTTDLINEAQRSPLAAMLFFAGYETLSHRKNVKFFNPNDDIKHDGLRKIAQVHAIAVKALLTRPDIVAKLEPFHDLAKIAGTNLDYANIVLCDFPDVVINMINTNQHNNFGFEVNLGMFLVLIGESSHEHMKFIDDFNASDYMINNYHARKNIDLIY